MSACSAAECDGTVKARGYCLKHYTRVIRYGSPSGFKPRPALAERFWAKVNKTPTCWLWTGAADQHGYGHLNIGHSVATSKYVKSHRFAYEQLVGPIPAGLVLDHMCHTPACVNPAHLRAVPQRINSQNRNGLDPRSTSGFRGVTFHKPTGKYRAYVGHKRRQIHLGLFETAQEAAQVAEEARATYFDLPRAS